VARAEDGAVVTADHLSPELRRVTSALTAPGTPNPPQRNTASFDIATQSLNLADAMSELERRMIAEALRKHSGNISRAARELGLTRRGLYLKLERHSLKIASA
jgi:DNA-binding NtrC family response regulator